jgi:hypothetical protein
MVETRKIDVLLKGVCACTDADDSKCKGKEEHGDSDEIGHRLRGRWSG